MRQTTNSKKFSGTKLAKRDAVGQTLSHRARKNSARHASAERLFDLPWLNERARRLHRICLGIERRRNRGQTMDQAMKWAVWYWSKGRTYASAPGRSVQFSKGTLVRAFYDWRKAGRKRSAFALNYTRREPVPTALVKRFIRANAERDTYSMRAAWRALRPKGVSARVLIGALPAKVRAEIGKAQRERLLLARAEMRQRGRILSQEGKL